MKRNHPLITGLDSSRRISQPFVSKVFRNAWLLAGIVMMAGGSGLEAETFTWGNSGNSYWGDPSNWGGSGIPNAVGDSAAFSGNGNVAAILADTAGNDASFTVTSLSSSNASYNFSVGNVTSGTGALIFDAASGSGASIATIKNSGKAASLNVSVVLNTDLTVSSRGAVGLSFLKSITSGSGLTTGLTIAGTPSGKGESGAYVTIGAASTYTGNTTIAGSASKDTGSGGGKLRISGTDFLPTTTVMIVNASNLTSNAQGGRFSLNGFNQTIAGLSGDAGTSSGMITNDTAALTTGTLTINNSGDYSFAGTVADAATAGNLGVTALTKSGTGTQTLTGNNTYTGATLISEGTLVVGVDGNGSLGNTAVTVGVNGVLAGSGTIDGAVILNGTLAPGNSPGTLTINNSLTMSSTASTLLQLAGTSAGQFDRVVGLTDLTLEGTITISLLDFSPVIDDTFDLFDWSGSLNASGFDTLTDLLLPTLTEGLAWDTSQFLSNGTISVMAVPEASTLQFLGLGLLGGVLILSRERRHAKRLTATKDF